MPADLIKDGETIFLDASTSAWHLARYIKGKRGITVITNAEKIVNELSMCDHIHVVCVGGELTPRNIVSPSFIRSAAYFPIRCLPS